MIDDRDEVRVYPNKDDRTSDDYISPSQIKTYIRCPYAFYLKYIIGLEPDYVPDKVKRGTKLHEEILYNEKYNFIANPEYAIIEPVIERVVDIRGFNVLLRGLPDVITNAGIYDLKTTYSIRFLNFASYYDKIQMTVYSLITNFEYPTYIVKYYPLFNRDGETPVSFTNTIHVRVNDKLVKRVEEAIAKIVKLKRTFVLEDKPAGIEHPERCEECSFRGTCPFSSVKKWRR